jgi:hypothetical protein
MNFKNWYYVFIIAALRGLSPENVTLDNTILGWLNGEMVQMANNSNIEVTQIATKKKGKGKRGANERYTFIQRFEPLDAEEALAKDDEWTKSKRSGADTGNEIKHFWRCKADLAHGGDCDAGAHIFFQGIS